MTASDRLSEQASSAAAGNFKSIRDLRVAVMAKMNTHSQISNIQPDEKNDTSITSIINSLEVILDVGNLFDYIRIFPNENAVELIENLILASIQMTKSKPEANSLLPIIRTADALETYGYELVPEKVGGDLAVAYVFREAEGYTFVQRDDLNSLNSSDVRLIAIRNLASLSEHLTMLDDGGSVVLFGIEGHSGLTPSLLLLDDFRKRSESRFPQGAIVIIPRRDQLFLIDRGDPNAMSHARTQIDKTWTGNYALQSRGIYEHRDGKLFLLEMC